MCINLLVPTFLKGHQSNGWLGFPTFGLIPAWDHTGVTGVEGVRSSAPSKKHRSFESANPRVNASC